MVSYQRSLSRLGFRILYGALEYADQRMAQALSWIYIRTSTQRYALLQKMCMPSHKYSVRIYTNGPPLASLRNAVWMPGGPIVSLHCTVRGITCKSYNIYHLKKLKLCLFNNEFKVRLSKVTYLGYIWNYLRQGQILGRQKFNLFKLNSSLFFWSSMTSRTNF